MKTLLLTMAGLALLSPLAALAQGGSGAKGGDAVVCFDRVVKGVPAYVDETGKLTDTGTLHAVAAYSREHWLLFKTPDRGPFINSLEPKLYEPALEEIIKRFDDYPLFSELLRQHNAELKSFTRGPRLTGVEDINDSGVDFSVPDTCWKFQGVVRDLNRFKSNETVTLKLLETPSRAAMMQAHELIYYVATEYTRQKTSAETEQLMLDALGSDLSTEELGVQLTMYGFPGASVRRRDDSTLYLTRQNITDNSRQRISEFEARLDEISSRMNRGPLPCPRTDEGPFTRAFPPEFSSLHLTLVERGYVPRKFAKLANEVEVVAKAVVSEMKISTSWSSDDKCLYHGVPVTKAQKDRIQASVQAYLEAIAARP